MDYREKIDHFRHLADKWECGEQLLLTGELQLGNVLRDAADTIEILLKERETVVSLPPNSPLTLEKLRKMDGEPVYITYTDSTLFREKCWGIVSKCTSTLGIANALTKYGFVRFSFTDYGKTWLAYRRKPEEGAKNEN